MFVLRLTTPASRQETRGDLELDRQYDTTYTAAIHPQEDEGVTTLHIVNYNIPSSTSIHKHC